MFCWDQSTRCLLSDFGLALFTSDREVIQVKEHFGNLSYMAPELIQGKPVPASDQYALAVMVYEWLCGHRPFEGLTPYLSKPASVHCSSFTLR